MIEIRCLDLATGDDHALGQALVREYVEATAVEMAEPGEAPDLDQILPYIPDYHDIAARFGAGSAFLVARSDADVAGCVALTRVDDRRCEMNRLWVREPYRSSGLGRALAVASMDEARRLGYGRMILDVLGTRTRAIALYRSLGFTDAEPFHTYTFDIVYLGRDL